MKHLLFVFFTLFLGTNILAQKPHRAFGAQKKADVTFEIKAVCGMCETRIEQAYDVKGIVVADYDLESYTLHVVYKTKHFPDILDVHRLAVNVGHDTDLMKASDEAYANLHGCCKYRDGSETQKCSGEQ